MLQYLLFVSKPYMYNMTILKNSKNNSFKKTPQISNVDIRIMVLCTYSKDVHVRIVAARLHASPPNVIPSL